MDDQTAQLQSTNQQPVDQVDESNPQITSDEPIIEESTSKGDDASSALMDILQGNLNVEKIIKETGKEAVVNKTKFSNKFLRLYVKNLRKSNIDDTKILNIILELDEKVELGEIDEHIFDSEE